jgi:hypothetical protein
VSAIETTTSAAVASPSAAISPSAIRKPSSATAQRSSTFMQNVMPWWNKGCRASGLSAIPITSASTMAGMGATRPMMGAAVTATTATSAESASPGRIPRA